MEEAKVNEVLQRVEQNREAIIRFMREIVAIPSMDGQIREVGERIGEEMRRLGFDEVRFDKMGNILGRMHRERPQGHGVRLPH